MTDHTLDRSDGIAMITMRAPERRNALTVPMAQAMSRHARRSTQTYPSVP